MKAFTSILKLALIALMFSVTSLHAQWDSLYHNNTIVTNDIFFISGTGYAVGNNWSSAVITKTTDGGQTWNNIPLPIAIGNDTIIDLRSVYFTTPTVGYVAALCQSDSAIAYQITYGAIIKTTDGGNTWSVILSTKNQINYYNGASILFYSIQFTSLYSGYIAASRQNIYGGNYMGYVYSTTNAGVNWSVSSPFTGSTANAVSFDNSGTGTVVGGRDMYSPFYNIASSIGKIARSTDGGSTWTITHTDNSVVYCDVSFPSSQIGYTVGDTLYYDSMSGYYFIGHGNLVKTTDNGQSWNVVSGFPANFTVKCIYFTDNLTGYIGGQGSPSSGNSIYKTTNGGLTWVPETFNGPTNQHHDIKSFAFATPVTGYAVADSTFDGSSFILGDFPQSSCSVFLGPDTTFCQTQGQLFATPATPGNDYTFSWSPSTGLSDSTAQAPFVNHVANQQYVVTMTDTVLNCTATDTIVVSAYEAVWGPQYICSTLGDSTLMDLGPGATSYQWQFYQDTAGNTTSLGNLNQQTYWGTQEGYYLAIAFSPLCGALTSYIQVLDTCGTYAWVNNVWPGDCNYDLTANNADALSIGLAYNTTGPVRPGASNSWYAQPMADWTQNFTNCNYKHADANGDGIVNANDTLPISLNYGNTHPYRLQPVVAPASAPQLYLVANYDTVGLQTLVTVDVRLGTSAVPIDSIYGISFRITSDAGLIDTALTTINLNTTWLGTMNTDMFGFRKYFRTPGIVDVAECGNNHTNRVNGNGTVATFLIVTTDNLSGVAVCHFNLSDITAVTEGQSYLNLNTVNDSVVIDPARPAGIQESGIRGPEFSLYPNPANTDVTVQTNSPATSIEICDLLGRTISTFVPNSNSTTLNTSTLAEGVYLLRVKNKNSISTRKLSVTH